MNIKTIESDFEYRMKKIINKFKKDYKLEYLTAEELQEKMWGDARDNQLAAEFGRKVLEACNEFSGDELFED